MTVLDKIKAFFKWCGEGIIKFSEPKPEAKDVEKKAAEPADTSEASEKKVDKSSSK